MTYNSTLLAQSASKDEIQKADLDLLKKINDTIDNVSPGSNTLETLTNPDPSADSLVIFDQSAAVNKRVTAGVLTAPPIGFVYWQLPGKVDPATLYPGTTWSNISSSFPGDFFRAEGGNASAFGSGEQPMGLQTHSHSLDESNYSGAGNSVAVGISPSMYPGNSNTNNSGGLETRPVNRTIRLWERTA